MEDSSRKKTRTSVKDEQDDTGEKAKTSNEERSNQNLTYDVLRIIFKYLNGMDLSSAARVCRSWLEAANNEKRTRGPISLIANYEKFLPKEKSTMECLKTQIIKNLTIKPALGLFFTNPTVVFGTQDCHSKVLPRNCNTVTLGTHGVISDNKELEKNLGAIVCAFLPQLPNVKIRTFVLGRGSSRGARNHVPKSVEGYSQQLKRILGAPKKTSGSSKCLLLFCDLYGRSLARQILNSLKPCYPGDVLSIWGGVANDLLVCNSKTDEKDEYAEFAFCVGITLIGSVDTWSIIVDETHKTKEQVEHRLNSLKNSVQLKKHSMGFMFACCARGESMFNECHVESSIFKRLFPEVPLVGCFGYGEFGENTIPNESAADVETKEWYNERSTVFMILTYG